VHYYYCF